MRKIIIGLGGFGRNFIDDIKSSIDTLVITDMDSIKNSKAKYKINLNKDSFENIIEDTIKNYDQIIIVSGLGGKSSTKLLQIVKILEKNKKVLEVIVNKPFSWEGEERTRLSESIIDKLVDQFITIKIFDNNNMKNYIDKDIGTNEAFKIHSNVIYEYIVQKYISEN